MLPRHFDAAVGHLCFCLLSPLGLCFLHICRLISFPHLFMHKDEKTNSQKDKYGLWKRRKGAMVEHRGEGLCAVCV